MAVVKFGQMGTALREPKSVKELSERIDQLERYLEYILTHLDKQNFTPEFAKQNNLK